MKKRFFIVSSTVIVSVLLAHGQTAALQQSSNVPAQSPSPQRALINQYCVSCHNQKLKTAGLMLGALDVDRVGENAAIWEKVVRKLRAGMMPPAGSRRPDPAAYESLIAWLENQLDRNAR
ncbi:MAG TPA: c-type cytochrome, partial [Hyphomicrobiaceae bacterium]|nr:c-type cytochrome [Hyphomicrobiaceae bacterium]